jgi:hypothetical protein
LLQLTRYQRWSVSLDHDCIRFGTVPRPMNFVARYAMEVARLAKKAALLDEKPNLASST